ncbi:hypothetical protein M5D96_001557, partial [Drosophila gunungcola]
GQSTFISVACESEPFTFCRINLFGRQTNIPIRQTSASRETGEEENRGGIYVFSCNSGQQKQQQIQIQRPGSCRPDQNSATNLFVLATNSSLFANKCQTGNETNPVEKIRIPLARQENAIEKNGIWEPVADWTADRPPVWTCPFGRRWLITFGRSSMTWTTGAQLSGGRWRR